MIVFWCFVLRLLMVLVAFRGLGVFFFVFSGVFVFFVFNGLLGFVADF